MDWTAAICSLTFIIPVMLNFESSFQWQAGAMAVLQSWVGLLMYLQRCCPPWMFWFDSSVWELLRVLLSSCRFEGVGIYVVMLSEIMKTLFRVVLLFFFLILAFSLAFHALMLNQVGKALEARITLRCVFSMCKSCCSLSGRVSKPAALSDANVRDDGRRTELPEQFPGPLLEG